MDGAASIDRSAEWAVVMAVFGASRRGSEFLLAALRRKIRERHPHVRIFLAETSASTRRRTGTPGLQEVLDEVRAAGLRAAAILPLQVFPGPEYRIIETTAAAFPGVRTAVAETLLHRWKDVRQVLRVVEQEFLAPGVGLNLLALHGSPRTADAVTGACLGVAQLAAGLYPHVLTATIEGVPDSEALFVQLAREGAAAKTGRMRLLPLLLMSGSHVEKDLLGDQGSWKARLEEMGFAVDCPHFDCAGECLPKTLACYDAIRDFYVRRLEGALLALGRS